MRRRLNKLPISATDDTPNHTKHLVQTQVLYLIASLLNCLPSMKVEADMVFRADTVVDFVTVKSSHLNSFQHPKIL
jgi:hypothetical protein